MSVYGQQFGFAAETTWGTVVTPDHFLPMLGAETMEYQETRSASMAVRAGSFGSLASRARRITYGAAGDVPLELSFSKLGLLLKQAMGSSASATLVSGSQYKQVHQIGSTDGMSLTLQLGRNEVSTGTVKPFTYPGAKIESLTIACSDSDTDAAQFTPTFDAKDESTATPLAAASYAAGNGAGAFTFADIGTMTFGGTAATTAGVVAITGGTAVTSLLKSFSLTIAVPGATDRRGLGNQGAKKEQKNNAIPSVTGSFAGEFTSQAEIYDVWKSDAFTPMQLTFSKTIGSINYVFDIVLPAIKFHAPPHTNGYDIPTQTVGFTAYYDDTNGNNMAQITYQNGDAAL